MWRMAFLGMVAATSLTWSEAGAACSIVLSDADRTPAGSASRASAMLARADAVIDGEVVRAVSEGQPALVYAHRVLRGPAAQWFYVADDGTDSCDTPLLQVGERMRMVLVQRPDRRTAEIYHFYTDQGNAAYEDRILGSDRRRDYPYFAGPR
jgi:hypothetical protein